MINPAPTNSYDTPSSSQSTSGFTFSSPTKQPVTLPTLPPKQPVTLPTLPPKPAFTLPTLPPKPNLSALLGGATSSAGQTLASVSSGGAQAVR